MPTLITPAPERSLWRIPDKQALQEWTQDRKIGWRLRANLGQLLGFDEIGTSGTRAGHGRQDYFSLDDVTWMYHEDQDTFIPLFGTGPKKFEQLQKQATIGFQLRKFQSMLAKPGLQSEDGWWVGVEPASVASLPNGSSLFGIARTPASAAVPGAQLPPAPLPDYGAQSATAFHMPMDVGAQGLTWQEATPHAAADMPMDFGAQGLTAPLPRGADLAMGGASQGLTEATPLTAGDTSMVRSLDREMVRLLGLKC